MELQAVVPLGRLGLRLTQTWLLDGLLEMMNWVHKILVPLTGKKHLLSSSVTCFPRESPGVPLLMFVFSVNTFIKLFKYCDNMANKQKDNPRRRYGNYLCVHELTWEWRYRSTIPMLHWCLKLKYLSLFHPQEVRKASVTGHGAKEEKQCGFLEGSLSACLLGTSDITVACGSRKAHWQKGMKAL